MKKIILFYAFLSSLTGAQQVITNISRMSKATLSTVNEKAEEIR